MVFLDGSSRLIPTRARVTGRGQMIMCQGVTVPDRAIFDIYHARLNLAVFKKPPATQAQR